MELNAANAYYRFKVCSSHLNFSFLCTNKQILLNIVVRHGVALWSLAWHPLPLLTLSSDIPGLRKELTNTNLHYVLATN